MKKIIALAENKGATTPYGLSLENILNTVNWEYFPISEDENLVKIVKGMPLEDWPITLYPIVQKAVKNIIAKYGNDVVIIVCSNDISLIEDLLIEKFPNNIVRLRESIQTYLETVDESKTFDLVVMATKRVMNASKFWDYLDEGMDNLVEFTEMSKNEIDGLIYDNLVPKIDVFEHAGIITESIEILKKVSKNPLAIICACRLITLFLEKHCLLTIKDGKKYLGEVLWIDTTDAVAMEAIKISAS